MWLGAMNGLKAIMNHTFRNPDIAIPFPKNFPSILHDCIHIMNDRLRSYLSHMIEIMKGCLQALELKLNLRYFGMVVNSIDPALVRFLKVWFMMAFNPFIAPSHILIAQDR